MASNAHVQAMEDAGTVLDLASRLKVALAKLNGYAGEHGPPVLNEDTVMVLGDVVRNAHSVQEEAALRVAMGSWAGVG
jgi:hypothetical protein